MDRSRSINRLALLLGIVSLSVCLWSFWKAYAATRTYTGASISNPNPALRNNLWSNPLNWSGNLLPGGNDDLVFGAAPPSNNDFPTGTIRKSISIEGGHIMTGNGVALVEGVVASGGQIFLSSIAVVQDQDFNAPLANAGANITSSINLTNKTLGFSGPGTLLISGVVSGLARRVAVRKHQADDQRFMNSQEYRLRFGPPN